MTDATYAGTVRAIDVTSEGARRRLKQRYAREARFKAYGLAAIAFAALFVVILLVDIGLKAVPAVTVGWLDLEVPVKAELVDPDGTKDPAVIARGDFEKAAREALFAKFPAAAADRKSRRLVQQLLSSSAADELRAAVVGNPELVGSTVATRLQLSSDADLYVRGVVAERRVIPGATNATPSGTSGQVKVLLDANAFAEELRGLRNTLARDADRAARQGELSSARLAEYQSRLVEAQGVLEGLRASGSEVGMPAAQAVVDKFKGEVDLLDAQAAKFAASATDKRARAQATGGTEVLDATTPSVLIAMNGGIIKVASLGADVAEGEVVVPMVSQSAAKAGDWTTVIIDTPEENRKISDAEIANLETLRQAGAISTGFNWGFFTSGDSREAELAGILSSLVGSALTMLVTLSLCLPIGVLAAIYLEEFAPKNRWTDLVEVNINNLAAVPSIVFGLLGLAVFIGFFGLPASSPLVGGLVLSLLVLPTIIIASRAALKSVPPSIREAALGVGASKQQAVFQHVLPLAMPGILTGTIIGMAHALGETAPLLMIGMIAFIVDVPGSLTQSATVLPVQIFLWADLPELGFQAKTALAILVLLAFLFVMNGMAILLRKRFERRW